MNTGLARPLAVALLLVASAGCSGLGGLGFDSRGPPSGGDELGYENGRWHDESLNVTGADGLDEQELEAVVARTMARVELIRGLEFERSVPVEVVSREEYRSQRGPSPSKPTETAVNEQVWEAPLLVGEEGQVADAFDTIFGSSVQGFYSPSGDRIVLVTDKEPPTVDTRTLAHELVHALQDQHFSLNDDRATTDGRYAVDGLVEGDANVVEDRYVARCGSKWSCLPSPKRGGGGTPTEFNFGVFLTVYSPYAEGSSFVNNLRRRDDGWSAVNEAYDAFPRSTEQVIHPEAYPGDRPTDVTVADRSNGAWTRFDLENNGDTLGEAAVYAMFWANGQVDRSRDPYNYSHPLSTGWDGDRVVPYTNGSHGGYVWKLVFDSPADAREFRDGYVRALRSRDATSPAADVYVVPEGDPFADAFRVRRTGDTVVVVNAPTTGDLSAVHG